VGTAGGGCAGEKAGAGGAGGAPAGRSAGVAGHAAPGLAPQRGRLPACSCEHPPGCHPRSAHAMHTHTHPAAAAARPLRRRFMGAWPDSPMRQWQRGGDPWGSSSSDAWHRRVQQQRDNPFYRGAGRVVGACRCGCRGLEAGPACCAAVLLGRLEARPARALRRSASCGPAGGPGPWASRPLIPPRRPHARAHARRRRRRTARSGGGRGTTTRSGAAGRRPGAAASGSTRGGAGTRRTARRAAAGASRRAAATPSGGPSRSDGWAAGCAGRGWGSGVARGGEAAAACVCRVPVRVAGCARACSCGLAAAAASASCGF
jgi:hypothetical protein